MTADPIELSTESLTLRVDVDGAGRVALTGITGGGTSLQASHHAPAIELQFVDEPHRTPVLRLADSTGGAELRYREHATGVEAGTHWLAVTADDADRVSARWLLRTRTGSAAVTSTVKVTNIGSYELSLGALSTLSLAVTGDIAGVAIGPDELDLITGASDWCGENRWQRGPVRDHLPALSSAAHRLSPKGAYSARVLGSWSTGGALPAGVLAARDDSFALAWQVEHNGAWRWDLAEEPAGLTLTLSGPTDADHQWCAVLRPGETFATVPATVAVGDCWQAAVGELTRHRRLARRPHADNERLTVIYNDFMNTLMGDPTTERLLPLVDAAAEAGAEAFCIDAGWYDDSMAGFAGWWDYVGEWRPSTTRFPHGITEVLDRIRSRGLVPGLWLEPEVVGVRSPMAERLPDRRVLHPTRAPIGRGRALSPRSAPPIRSGSPRRHRRPAGRGPRRRLLQVRLQHQPRPGHRRGRRKSGCRAAGSQPSTARLAGGSARPAPGSDHRKLLIRGDAVRFRDAFPPGAAVDQRPAGRGALRADRDCRADADAAGAGRFVGLPERGDGP